MPSITALIDCDNFFVSCERVFNPSLKGKPVVVLTNNDGRIISRSKEAKQLGIKMGDPLFQLKQLIKDNDVKVFSSNFALYADLSSRVMSILATFFPNTQIYSIDEAFADISHLHIKNCYEYAKNAREQILKCTGIPVSIGISYTKTLAKCACEYAKKHPANKGVLAMFKQETINTVLKSIPVNDVWGIGQSITNKLQQYYINTAYDLKIADYNWIRHFFSVSVMRTVLELQGESCIQTIPSQQKSMIDSRSFSRPVYRKEELEESLIMHAENMSAKLRDMELLAKTIGVFIKTSHHEERYFSNFKFTNMEKPSADTRNIIEIGKKLLKDIYIPGIRYKKLGMFASNLISVDNFYPTLFDYQNSHILDKRATLLKQIDNINKRWGTNTIHIARFQPNATWRGRHQLTSPRYTTCWQEIPRVYYKP